MRTKDSSQPIQPKQVLTEDEVERFNGTLFRSIDRVNKTKQNNIYCTVCNGSGVILTAVKHSDYQTATLAVKICPECKKVWEQAKILSGKN